MGKVRGVVAREHGGHARGGTRRGRREDAKGEEERLAPRDLTAVPQAAAVRLAPVFPAVHLHDHHLEHDHDGEQRVRDIPLVGVLSVRVRDDVHRDLYLGIPPETPRVRAGALLAEPMERHRRRRRRRRHRRARDGGRVRRHGVAQNAPRPADRRRSEVPAESARVSASLRRHRQRRRAHGILRHHLRHVHRRLRHPRDAALRRRRRARGVAVSLRHLWRGVADVVRHLHGREHLRGGVLDDEGIRDVQLVVLHRRLVVALDVAARARARGVDRSRGAPARDAGR